jgi:CheY-like chemotaxis protein
VLGRGGFNVVAGGSAREVLESLDLLADPPDLLLTDVVMPETNGIELARLVRTRYPALPVVFMSGYHDSVSTAAPDTVTSDRLLQKPVSPDVLLQAVHESLGTLGCAVAAGALGGTAARDWMRP